MIAYASYQEYLDLPEFRAVCDIVRKRSGGICERCRNAQSTEFHHKKYCRWGDVDAPENLEDVCHSCHCDYHRCLKCSQVNLKARHIKRNLKVCDQCIRK